MQQGLWMNDRGVLVHLEKVKLTAYKTTRMSRRMMLWITGNVAEPENLERGDFCHEGVYENL